MSTSCHNLVKFSEYETNQTDRQTSFVRNPSDVTAKSLTCPAKSRRRRVSHCNCSLLLLLLLFFHFSWLETLAKVLEFRMKVKEVLDERRKPKPIFVTRLPLELKIFGNSWFVCTFPDCDANSNSAAVLSKCSAIRSKAAASSSPRIKCEGLGNRLRVNFHNGITSFKSTSFSLTNLFLAN